MPADRIPIARFSAITRISQKALRYYDRKGILVPAAKDRITGYRYYTASQMEEGVKIRALCSLGFSLDDLKAYLQAGASGDRETAERLKDAQLSSIRSELLRLQRIEALLQEETEELIGMALTEPTVKYVPEQRVLIRREKGILSQTIGKLIGELCSFVALPASQRNQLKVTGPIMSIYNEDCTDGMDSGKEGGKENFEGADLSDWSDKEVTIEVALPIAGKAEVEGSGIQVKSLPAARVLSLIHKGSYPTIHKSYRVAFEHMAGAGLEVAGPIRELYLNDPAQTAEEDLMTEIQIPLAAEQK